MTKDLTISQYLQHESVSKNINDTLKERAQQFTTSIISLVNSTPALKECDKLSLLTACMTAASMNLPINQNLGFAYIIPYKGMAQFQMGYKGFIQLAIRSNQFETINVSDVRDGEIEKIDRLSGKISFSWMADGRDMAKISGYVAYFKMLNGFEKTLYMTVDELKSHGVKFSQSMRKGYGLWKDDFDSMAKKTVLKLLLSKYALLNTQMNDVAKALEVDQAVITDDGIMYVDNKKEVPEEVAEEKEIERLRQFVRSAKTTGDLTQCKTSVNESNDENLQQEFSAKWADLSIAESPITID